jgi:protein ImuB
MPELSVLPHPSVRVRKAPLHDAPGVVGHETAAARPAELWLCIELPRLPIDALSSGRSEPAAAVEQKAGRIEVTDCNRAARQEGIGPGMPLAAALSLNRDLGVYPRDRDAEQQKLTRFADWSLAFSDRVALYGDRSIVLGIRGSLRLFGGLAALLQKVAGGLDRFGFEYGMAVAPSPKAALWLAQHGGAPIVENPRELASALRLLPVSKVARDRRHLARLQHSGIRTLGDLMRLSRAGVARRFGAATLEMLDLALAKRPETVNGYSPPACFSAERGFYLPTCDLDLIRPAANALLEDLAKYLAAGQLATRLFYCEWIRNSLPLARVAVGCRRPAHAVEHMRLLLEEHLGRMRIEAEITSIRIVCTDFEPLAARQSDLFQMAKTEDRSWSGLIERMEARLGRNALKRLAAAPDHRPERASLCTAPDRRQAMPKGTGRPLWLLENPEPLGLKHGKPCWHGPLDRLSRCERIEQGWWDGFDISRDYWIAENAAGSRLWIYRDRRGRGWFLHGIFA